MNDEMINIFSMGVGIKLGKIMRFSYFELKKILIKNAIYSEQGNESKQIIIDILALSIFYNRIILPLSGAHNFIGNLPQYKVGEIGMGSYKIDMKQQQEIHNCVSRFYAILKKYKIPLNNLVLCQI